MDNVIDTIVFLAVSDDLEDAVEVVLPEFPSDKVSYFKEELSKLLHNVYKSDFIVEEGEDDIGDDDEDDLIDD